ncbi:n-acyl-phosphatidylethanolamine-hydrolyzing phospholipase d [Echinococcus multilocularis]|uniref:N-acyl-phosphatidylethanolamine-hydrolyzing phospholipase d n=2 Tax=Echinococcus TaxID=6209 RepID=A0A087VZG9_ECHMU|nr:n-acyl-phosphatidylethanolamine-hydrolyzing phospholipase d [Echinococcus multilocularis]
MLLSLQLFWTVGLCIFPRSMAENLTQVKITSWGRFANPWSTWEDTRLRAGFVLGFTAGDVDCSPLPSDLRLARHLPIYRPKFEAEGNGVRLTWLGHSSVLVYVDGVRVLCDPVFSERCSASQYIGPRRYRPPPCKVEDLPPIDAVVISHNHYDHLDVNSVRDLSDRFPQAHWFVPSGCRDFILSTANEANESRVHDFLWWEERPVGDTGVKAVFTPTQHWSARNFLFDSFATLWGSWALIGPKHRVWFGGDTGYCDAFKEIGGHLGPFDVAAIPIGAYEPRWVLKSQHVNPWEAVEIHKDIRAKYSVGIHWGTFPLTQESFMAPKTALAKALQTAGLHPSEFRTIHHGQSLCFHRDSSEDASVKKSPGY